MAYCEERKSYVPDELVDRWEEELTTELGALDFLEALLRCMSIDEKADYFAFIGRCYEVELSEEESK